MSTSISQVTGQVPISTASTTQTTFNPGQFLSTLSGMFQTTAGLTSAQSSALQNILSSGTDTRLARINTADSAGASGSELIGGESSIGVTTGNQVALSAHKYGKPGDDPLLGFIRDEISKYLTGPALSDFNAYCDQLQPVYTPKYVNGVEIPGTGMFLSKLDGYTLGEKDIRFPDQLDTPSPLMKDISDMLYDSMFMIFQYGSDPVKMKTIIDTAIIPNIAGGAAKIAKMDSILVSIKQITNSLMNNSVYVSRPPSPDRAYNRQTLSASVNGLFYFRRTTASPNHHNRNFIEQINNPIDGINTYLNDPSKSSLINELDLKLSNIAFGALNMNLTTPQKLFERMLVLESFINTNFGTNIFM